jgi:hypothetical protein
MSFQPGRIAGKVAIVGQALHRSAGKFNTGTRYIFRD